MKKALLFFSIFISSFCVLAQNTGTIKIVKPVKKDTIASVKSYRLFVLGGINYTYLKNTKSGYCFRVGYFYNYKSPHPPLISLQYSNEYRYFNRFNFNYGQSFISKSQTSLEYIKLSLHYFGIITIGSRSSLNLGFGLGCKYLINSKNEDGYFFPQNFQKYNGFFSFEMNIPIVKRRLFLNFSYNRDVFENLKDNKLYDINNNVIGKQKSKITVTSISLAFNFSATNAKRQISSE